MKGGWTGILVFLIGIWLMAAPDFLGYGGAAADNDRIFGPIAASFAFISIWEVARGLRWCNAPIGLWFVVAPWILDYSRAGAWSAAIAGTAMVLLSILSVREETEFGGGWSSLWRPWEMP